MTEVSRYHRQTLLEGIGEAGQTRLGESHALLVGCGALGCVIADWLVRAGVGTLTIVDRDVVEQTNLQRQVLFEEADAREGLPKAEAARRRLTRVNSAVEVRAVVADVSHVNVERIGGLDGKQHNPGGPRHHEHNSGELCYQQPCRVILDGTDNFETRYLLNDVAIEHGVPLVYAGVVGTSGTGMVVAPDQLGGGPCLRCVWPEIPAPGSTATCDTAGVLGPAVGTVASWQAAEALKILTGNLDAVCRGLVAWEIWDASTRMMDISAAQDGACACCGERRFEFLDGEGASRTTTLCGRDAVQVSPASTGNGRIDLGAVATRLKAHGQVTANEFLVRARLQSEADIELTMFADGRVVVRGTDRADVARGICAKYVGS